MRKQPMIVVLVLSVLSASAAQAQSWDEPGIQLQVPASLTQRYRPRDPATAALISAAATLGSIAAGVALIGAGEDTAVPGLAVLGFGLTFGPSMGHYYAGERGRGTIHGLIRSGLFLGGGAMMIAGFASAFSHDSDDDGQALMWGGLGLLTVCGIHAIYGIIDSAFAAKRANKRAATRALSFAPLVAKSPTGEMQYGLAVAGRF